MRTLGRQFVFGATVVLVGAALGAERPRISDDRDLKEYNLAGWPCLQRAEGSARTPDGQERNRLKNRSAPEGPVHVDLATDVAGLLTHVAEFERIAKNAHRKDVIPGQREKLTPLEKQIVSVTGYIQLAYCGPPETTNCGNGDFHDWHLEVLGKPIDHPPQPGDATPIVCEITPRTQNALYRDGVRIQELAAFFRKPDMSYEPTGHLPVKVKLTGYLLWDDEHNGTADVGETIHTAPPMRFHNPWREAAWELHPVFKIERADGSTTHSAPSGSSELPGVSPSSSGATGLGSATPPAEMSPMPTATAMPVELVTTRIALTIPTPQGQVVIPRAARLPVRRRDTQTVTVEYNGQTVIIPQAYIDPR
jgi:hypothetical protein